jgi:cell division protein FtsW
MTCAALGLLLRVSYELDRAERQVARLRGEASPSVGEAPPAPAPSHAMPASTPSGRGGARPRTEPALALASAGGVLSAALRKSR